MSSYIERYCRIHGEWSMDVDNVRDCPTCESQGLTELQRLRKKLSELKKEMEEGYGCKLCHCCGEIKHG